MDSKLKLTKKLPAPPRPGTAGVAIIYNIIVGKL
jgi:hypothetical protein